jgi:hypothetical protein
MGESIWLFGDRTVNEGLVSSIRNETGLVRRGRLGTQAKSPTKGQLPRSGLMGSQPNFICPVYPALSPNSGGKQRYELPVRISNLAIHVEYKPSGDLVELGFNTVRVISNFPILEG